MIDARKKSFISSEYPHLKKVNTLGAGQSFGELALTTDKPRTATG